MYKSWKAGQRFRAISETPFTPIAIRNATRAIQLLTIGQVTRSGKAISAPGEVRPRKITTKEAIQKGVFGIQPTSVSSGYKAYQATRRVEEAIQERKKNWADRFVNAKRRGDAAEMERIRREVRKWNKAVRAEGKNHLVVQLRGMIRSRLRPSGKQIPKRLRREAKRIAEQWQ